MTDEEKQVVKRLILAAKPFLSKYVVDETSGTLYLMGVLEDAIDDAEELIGEELPPYEPSRGA